MDTNDKARLEALEERIHKKECELQQHYSQMGKELLEMAEGEQRVVNRLVDEIIEARAQLVNVKGQKECPTCTAYNDADSRYCKRCGAALNEPKEEAEKEIS
ncbi:MAG: hypothetical protein AB7V55_08470 [Oscillospiraceae bacterium]